MFSINRDYRDYDIFCVTKYEFIEGFINPWIPVRHKQHGTLYPLKYDIDDKD